MLSIGAFADLGDVSVRMLRHWDEVGLLTPAHVDERTGYRSYDPAQLHRLHRIVALRALGFGLDDVATMLADAVDVDGMRVLLERRRGTVEAEHALALARLADVRARLRAIEEEEPMHTTPIEIVLHPIPALRLVARTADVADRSEISAAVESGFAGAADDLGHAEGALEVPIVQYRMHGGEDADPDEGMTVITGYAVDGPVPAGADVVELPAVELAACAVHLGSMEHIGRSWAALHAAIAERGLVPNGDARERYVRAERDDQRDWVTELQQPVHRA